MEPHGKVLLVIGVIGTILILVFSSRITGSDHNANAATASATATATAIQATVTPVSTPSPAPTQTAAPQPAPVPVVNRTNCNAIRGTDYHSGEERAWFIANCG